MEASAEQLVAAFLNEYRASGTYLRGHIARVAELASSEDAQVAEAATKAVFTSLVEPLADCFDPDSVALYNRAFAQIVQTCRRNPSAVLLDEKLERFGLQSEEHLIARSDSLRVVSKLAVQHDSARPVQRVIVLSRVTLGADVAITSVILERLKRTFPAADIVLAGGAKAAQLFGGDPKVSFKEIGYGRAGTTIARLLSWVDLIECVQELTHGLQPTEYLIVDPDTRLTQLGLLPITPAFEKPHCAPASAHHRVTAEPEWSDYLFFPSREYGSATSQSLGELTSAWLDQVLGETVATYPRVSPSDADLHAARWLVKRMKRPIIAINFGVGENQRKRVGGDFEASLVAHLIREGATIILDKGAGKDEISRADAVIAHATQIEREGRPVRAVEVDEQHSLQAPVVKEPDAELLVWNGRIGLLAALISESDLYIGYDSAGQHIAAALGVPCIDVFAGFSSSRMLDRWRPFGKAETRVLPIDRDNAANPGGVVADVLRHTDDLLKAKE
jgi:ADP-heptose:LPS heptosyltransferase